MRGRLRAGGHGGASGGGGRWAVGDRQSASVGQRDRMSCFSALIVGGGRARSEGRTTLLCGKGQVKGGRTDHRCHDSKRLRLLLSCHKLALAIQPFELHLDRQITYVPPRQKLDATDRLLVRPHLNVSAVD